MLVTGGIAKKSRVLVGCAQRRHADSRLPLVGTENEGAGADAKKAQPGGSLGSGLADHATRPLPSHWRRICITWQAAALLLAERGSRKVRSRGLIGWLESQALDYKSFWGLLLGGIPGLPRSVFQVPGSARRSLEGSRWAGHKSTSGGGGPGLPVSGHAASERTQSGNLGSHFRAPLSFKPRSSPPCL